MTTLPSFGWTKEQIVDWNEGAFEALRDHLTSGKAAAQTVTAIAKPVAKPQRKPKPVPEGPRRKRGQRITAPSGYFIKGNVQEATMHIQQLHRTGQPRPVPAQIVQTFGVSIETARNAIREFYGISNTCGGVENSARAEPRRQEVRRHLKGLTTRPTIKEVVQQFHISRISAAELIRSAFGSARANQ